MPNQNQIHELNAKYLACPHCDAIWNRPVLTENQLVRCKRCQSVIMRYKRDSQQRTLALTTSSLILYLVAVSFPFSRIEVTGLSNQISLLDCVTVLWQNDMSLLALIAGLFIILFPLCRIIMILLVCMGKNTPRDSKINALLLRGAQLLEPWAMQEIFLLGILISIVKLSSEATVQVGPSFWGMSALIISMALVSTSYCRDTLWQRIRANL